MKKIFLTIAFIASGLVASAQVGVGTENPQTSLHIVGANATDKGVTGANVPGALAATDGITVPVVTTEMTAPGTPVAGTRVGQMVYSNFVGKTGFYYWDGTTWVAVGGAGVDTSLYAGDGQLTGARTVDQNNNNLTFTTGTARAIVNGSFQTTGAVYAQVRTFAGAALLAGNWLATDYFLMITGAASGQISLPDATANAGRILIIHNATGGPRSFNTTNAGLNHPLNNASFASGTSLPCISDGSVWRSID